jgi:hypothetical protein
MSRARGGRPPWAGQMGNSDWSGYVSNWTGRPLRNRVSVRHKAAHPDDVYGEALCWRGTGLSSCLTMS